MAVDTSRVSESGWPDPARPGYPMHPERDGWHWLNGTPRLWEAKLQAWNFGDDDGHTWLASPETASLKGWSYLSPCLTPAEVAAALAQARREGMEEAARIVESVSEWQGQDYYCDSCKGGAIYPDREDVAAAIRRSAAGEGGK